MHLAILATRGRRLMMIHAFARAGTSIKTGQPEGRVVEHGFTAEWPGRVVGVSISISRLSSTILGKLVHYGQRNEIGLACCADRHRGMKDFPREKVHDVEFAAWLGYIDDPTSVRGESRARPSFNFRHLDT